MNVRDAVGTAVARQRGVIDECDAEATRWSSHNKIQTYTKASSASQDHKEGSQVYRRFENWPGYVCQISYYTFTGICAQGRLTLTSLSALNKFRTAIPRVQLRHYIGSQTREAYEKAGLLIFTAERIVTRDGDYSLKPDVVQRRCSSEKCEPAREIACPRR